MSSITLSGANARLSYNLRGAHVAKLRGTQLAVSYGVTAEETHAKRERAFYPHQRVQGTFMLRFDCIHWRESNLVNSWFRNYIEAVIDQQNPSYMQVQLDNRNFLRLAYPTTGVVFGDHKASMVFSPTITFISVADPRDPRSGIQSLNKTVSRATLPPGNQVSTNWFYPTSRLNSPGVLQGYLYNQQQEAAAAAAAKIQDLLGSVANHGQSATAGEGLT
jgi:hypothetical protein